MASSVLVVKYTSGHSVALHVIPAVQFLFPCVVLADEEEGSSASSEQEEDEEAAEESSDDDNDEGYKPPLGKKQRTGSVVSLYLNCLTSILS